MSDSKYIKSRTLATVDAAVTILEKYPDLTTTNTDLSYTITTNPFDLLIDIFKHTEGYEKFIDIISAFISIFLPIVEESVKALLVLYLKKFLACTLSPIITDDVLRDGVFVNLRDVDLTDKLQVNPLSDIGKYYYFGCDDFLIVDEVKGSKDFDCLIWYMLNKSVHRELWSNSKDKDGNERPVITMQFHERSTVVADAEGNSMNLQTPYNNALHVFIGDATEKDDLTGGYDNLISDLTNATTYGAQYQQQLNTTLEEIRDDLDDLETRYEQGSVTQESYEKEYLEYTFKIQELEYWIGSTYREVKAEGSHSGDYYKDLIQKTIETPIGELLNNWERYYDYKRFRFINAGYLPIGDIIGMANVEITSDQIAGYNSAQMPNVYPPIQNNRFYRKSLLYFNTEYVKSLKLFDSKVLAAQIIDQLVGILSIDLNLGLKRQMIQNEVEKMVEMVVETDDTVVNDCFFSFSNDEYNAMLEKTELRMAGLYTIDGEQNPAQTIDTQSLLDSLNGISADASEVEIQSIIAGAFTEISRTMTTTEEDGKLKLSASAQLNFIEKILDKVAMAIVMAILSPKIMLLIKINLQLVGQDTNFVLKDFIDIYKQMIVSMIRKVRDLLLDFLLKEVMKILSALASEIGAKIYAEQLAYYMRLLRRLVNAWRRRRSSEEKDWTMDDVDYADILDEEEEESDEQVADTSC